ncbi:hypothetical protein [Kineococcus arenarius]|uniref:hypothetical protein n=1 Tax=Kineococcus sp. SYSU DK007 TaxID=3383128 RepID=UPI003D7DC741
MSGWLRRHLYLCFVVLAGCWYYVDACVRALSGPGERLDAVGDATRTLLVWWAIACIAWLVHRLLAYQWALQQVHRPPAPPKPTAPRGGARPSNRYPTGDAGQRYEARRNRAAGTATTGGAPTGDAHGTPTGGAATPEPGERLVDEDHVHAYGPATTSDPATEPQNHDEERGPRTPPRVLMLHVDRSVVAHEMPVVVSWAFEGADDVVVQGVPGHPATGSTPVVLPLSGAIEVTAVNATARTTVHTGIVQVVPRPVVEAVQVPSPPSIRLHADVSSSVDAGRSAAQRLDALFSAQDAGRPAASAALSPIGLPPAVVRWLRGSREEDAPFPTDAPPPEGWSLKRPTRGDLR